MARSTVAVKQTADHDVDDLDAVMAASRALVAVAARSLAPVEEAVTLSQWRALVVVSGEPGVSLNEVAGALRVHASTATRLCDRLVAAGLLLREPDPQDRRYLALSLTRKGQRLVEKVTAVRRREIAQILDQLAPASRRRVALAFREFAEAAGELRADAAWRAAP